MTVFKPHEQLTVHVVTLARSKEAQTKPQGQMWSTLYVLSLACPALGNMTGFIVGGQLASIKDWPFIAYLYIYHENDQVASCGGSLISSQTVLTAAHCVVDIKVEMKKLGEISNDILMGHANHNKAIMRRTVINYRCHDKYDPDGTSYDISVMFMSHPVDFHPTVRKAVLMTRHMGRHMDNGDLVVAGWGRIGEDKPGSIMLKELKQKLVDQRLCYNYTNAVPDPGIFCGGSVNDTNYPFSGDSGGPLAQKRNQYLAGLVSWRIESQGVTVYTSVPYYYSWIETTQRTMFHEQCSQSRRNIKQT